MKSEFYILLLCHFSNLMFMIVKSLVFLYYNYILLGAESKYQAKIKMYIKIGFFDFDVHTHTTSN